MFAVKHDAIPFKSYENIKSTQLILHYNVLIVTDHYSHYAYSMRGLITMLTFLSPNKNRYEGANLSYCIRVATGYVESSFTSYKISSIPQIDTSKSSDINFM